MDDRLRRNSLVTYEVLIVYQLCGICLQILAFSRLVRRCFGALFVVLAVTARYPKGRSRVPCGVEEKDGGTYVETPLTYSPGCGICCEHGLCRAIQSKDHDFGDQDFANERKTDVFKLLRAVSWRGWQRSWTSRDGVEDAAGRFDWIDQEEPWKIPGHPYRCGVAVWCGRSGARIGGDAGMGSHPW